MHTNALFINFAQTFRDRAEELAERDADVSRRRYLSSRLLGLQLQSLERTHPTYARSAAKRYGLEPADIDATIAYLLSSGLARTMHVDWLVRAPHKLKFTHDICPSWLSWFGQPRRPNGSAGLQYQSLPFAPSKLDSLPRVDASTWRLALTPVAMILATGPDEIHNPVVGWGDALRNAYSRGATRTRERGDIAVATIASADGACSVYTCDDPRVDGILGVESLDRLARTLVEHNSSNIAAKLACPGGRLHLSSTPLAAFKLYWAISGLPVDETAMAIIAQTEPYASKSKK